MIFLILKIIKNIKILKFSNVLVSQLHQTTDVASFHNPKTQDNSWSLNALKCLLMGCKKSLL